MQLLFQGKRAVQEAGPEHDRRAGETTCLQARGMRACAQGDSALPLPLLLQVLQVLEQLLKSGDALLESGLKDLPMNSHTGAFLRELGRQLSLNPEPGEVIK